MRTIMYGGGGAPSFLGGSVDVYASLPVPIASYTGKLYFVEAGSGTELDGIFEYPVGLYTPNEANTLWVNTPINVEVGENSYTTINVTDWTEFYAFGITMTAGDHLTFNGATYVSLTGTQTTTAPDADQINWGSHLDISPRNITAYKEGRVFYNSSKKALSYYNDEAEVTVNLGQEVLSRVYNNSGGTMVNGSVVTNTIDGLRLADNRFKDRANLISMATHDIEDGTFGYVTRYGEVGGVDTSLCASGTVIYLGTDGGYSQTRPDDGHYSVILGVCKTVSATEGIMQFNPVTSQLTVEVTDTNGFPSTERSGTTISFTDATRTFTISPDEDDFHFYQMGDKYEKETSESLVIENTEGLHAIYYDEDILTETVNPTSGQIDLLIRTKVLVSYIYWDAVNSAHSYFADERHGISMSPTTHGYLHFTRGAQFLFGGGLGEFDLIGANDEDSSAQFSVATGMMADEDIMTITPSILSTAGLPIYYLEGATPNLRRVVQPGFSCYNTGSISGRIFYNELVGTTWQLTEIGSDNDFCLMHIFMINGVDGEDQIISVMGQNEYANRRDAREGASTEISSIITMISMEEAVPLGTVIFKTNDGYGNGVNARVQDNDDGSPYTDWRTTELAQGANPSSHANLTEVQQAGLGVTQGHIGEGSQEIYGVKSFNNPIGLKETTTPTAVAEYGKIYTKDDNKLYFQSGDGIEHVITMS